MLLLKKLYQAFINIASSKAGIILLLILAIAVRIAVVYDAAVRNVFMGIVPDDAFYYFAIAKNIAAGFGSTFDRLAPTNGYHPLWMGVLLPIFALQLPPEMTVWVAMALGGMIWSMGAIPLTKLAAILFDSREAKIALIVLYLFTPFSILFSINGLETALNVSASIVYFWFVAYAVARSQKSNKLLFLCYGIISGLFFLSRTDSAVFIMITTVALFMTINHPRNNKQCLIDLVISTSAGLLVVAPWLLWNLKTFGTIMQSSGKAMTFFIKKLAMQAEFLTPRDMLLRSSKNLLDSFSGLLTHSSVWFDIHPTAAGLFFTIVIATCFAIVRHTRAWQASKWLIMSPVIGYLAYIFIHSAVRWSVREWYFALPSVLIFISVIFCIEKLSPKVVLVFALLFTSMSVCMYYIKWHPGGGLYPWQNQGMNWNNIKRLDQYLPSGAALGHTDAGTLGYLMNRRVVNLDGLVNSKILPYYESSKIVQYLLDNDICYVCSRKPFIHPLFSGPLRLLIDESEPYKILFNTDELYNAHFPKQKVAFGYKAASKYLGVGWSEFDDIDYLPDRWSVGDHSIIYLPLKQNQNYLLTMNIRKFEAIKKQVITIKFNDAFLGQYEIPEQWIDLNTILPSSVSRDGINELNLEYSQNLRPSDVSNSLDKRPIAINVRAINVQLIRKEMVDHSAVDRFNK
jgi:hypothetical protein